MNQAPTLAEVLTRAIEARLIDLHVSIPAKVVSYDESKLKISAKPLIKRGYEDEFGERKTESLPIINDIPVVFPGSGGVRLKFPINKGDTIALFFSSQSLDKWLVKGGEVDPGDDRHHSFSDAIAIPGLQDFARARTASPVIEFTKSDEIHAGGSQQLALKSDVDALITSFNNFITLYGTHTHTSSGTGPPGTPGVPAGSAAGTQTLKGS